MPANKCVMAIASVGSSVVLLYFTTVLYFCHQFIEFYVNVRHVTHHSLRSIARSAPRSSYSGQNLCEAAGTPRCLSAGVSKQLASVNADSQAYLNCHQGVSRQECLILELHLW